jgi:hypothetical protein
VIAIRFSEPRRWISHFSGPIKVSDHSTIADTTVYDDRMESIATGPQELLSHFAVSGSCGSDAIQFPSNSDGYGEKTQLVTPFASRGKATSIALGR